MKSWSANHHSKDSETAAVAELLIMEDADPDSLFRVIVDPGLGMARLWLFGSFSIESAFSRTVDDMMRFEISPFAARNAEITWTNQSSDCEHFQLRHLISVTRQGHGIVPDLIRPMAGAENPSMESHG
jgi:hypothetical protein